MADEDDGPSDGTTLVEMKDVAMDAAASADVPLGGAPASAVGAGLQHRGVRAASDTIAGAGPADGAGKGVDASGSEDDGHDDDRHHGAPMKIHAILETNPCLGQCVACGVLLFFAALLIGSIATFGSDVLEFSTAVPMYLRDHETRVRSDMILEGKEVANAEAATSVPRQQELAEFKLQVLYLGRGGIDLLDPAEPYLARIQKIEKTILDHPDLSLYCQKTYTASAPNGTCARPLTPSYFFDPDFFKGVHTAYAPPSPPLCTQNTATTPPTCTGSPASWNMANTQLIGSSLLLDNSKFPTAVDLGASNVQSTSSYWANYHTKPFAFLLEEEPNKWVQTQLGNLFFRVVDSRFGIQSDGTTGTKATALMSTFFFGLPLAGFKSTEGEDFDKQRDKIADFLFSAYHDTLEAETEWEDNFVVLWQGEGMQDIYTQSQLATNGALVFGSIVFVLLYVSVVTGSFYIGVLGIAQIFLAFPPAILLYRFVFGYSYFGTLNLMSVFIIMGIGADDIFVFLDTWKQMKVSMRGSGVQARMSATLRHAGKAMATTSFSTIFAFGANATSSFPAVYTFGIWCALLVFSNFCIVCLFFPTVVAVQERYFAPKKCCGCCRTKKADGPSAKAKVSAVSKLPFISRWFRDTYYVKFIHPFRIPIVVAYAVMLVVMLIFAAQIVPDPNTPSLFFEGNNYIEFRPTLKAQFPRDGNPEQIKAWVVFGLKDLDRTDTDPTNAADRGQVVFDTEMNLASTQAQEFVINLCQDARAGATAAARKVSAPTSAQPEPVMCWMESFRDYVQLSGNTFPVSSPALFETLARAWMASKVLPNQVGYTAGATQYDVWKEYVYAEGVETSAVLRFFIIEVSTDIEVTTPFDEGITVYDEWKSWIQDQILTAPAGLTTGFVTDKNGFHYFHLQRTILREAAFGIFLSIVLAFLVLCLATGNYIIATLATLAILFMVLQVVGFTVVMGWKLGVLEAIVYVMVVGLSVDYVVHMSDAYLESGKNSRHDRTQAMLTIMGLSIVSGAVSTLGASFFLLMAGIVFFWKFGAVIFYIISLSLVTSLAAYAALLDLKGPEGNTGSITIGAKLALCCRRSNQSFWQWMADEDPHRRRLEAKLDSVQQQLRELLLTSRASAAMATEADVARARAASEMRAHAV